jgi:hypothetical protein
MMVAEEKIEAYQNVTKKYSKLDRYDQFYRTVGIPFIEM